MAQNKQETVGDKIGIATVTLIGAWACFHYRNTPWPAMFLAAILVAVAVCIFFEKKRPQN